MRVPCRTDVGSGMTIRGVGSFFCLAFELLMDLPSDLQWVLQEIWHCGFYVVKFCPFPPLDPPPVFTFGSLYILVCEFPSCLGVGLLFWFTDPIWIHLRGGCWGRQCDYDWVEPWQISWWDLWPTVFNYWSWLHLTMLHLLIYSKIIDQLLQVRTFPVTNLFDWHLLCRIFKNVPISSTDLVMAYVVDTKGIF